MSHNIIGFRRCFNEFCQWKCESSQTFFSRSLIPCRTQAEHVCVHLSLQRPSCLPPLCYCCREQGGCVNVVFCVTSMRALLGWIESRAESMWIWPGEKLQLDDFLTIEPLFVDCTKVSTFLCCMSVARVLTGAVVRLLQWLISCNGSIPALGSSARRCAASIQLTAAWKITQTRDQVVLGMVT